MSDAAVVWGPGGGDLAIEDGDLVADDGLASAVLISLFSDARLDGGSLLEGADPRGWWGEAAGERYGSLLWTLEREKTTEDLPVRVEEAARAALLWLVEGGYVEELELEASYLERGHILLRVRLVRGAARRGANLWLATRDYELPFGFGILQLATA